MTIQHWLVPILLCIIPATGRGADPRQAISALELARLTQKAVALMAAQDPKADGELSVEELQAWLSDARAPDDVNLKELKQLLSPWVIRVRARGTAPGDFKLDAENGTGFLYDTVGGPYREAMTALHVVRDDSEYAFDGANKPARVIEFDRKGDDGPIPHNRNSRPDIKKLGNQDAAVFYLDAEGQPGFRFTRRQVRPGEVVVAFLWPDSKGMSEARPVVVEPNGDAKNSTLLRLAGDFVKSESGSPIVGQDGLVVGVLTHHGLDGHKKPFGYAVPASLILDEQMPIGRDSEDQQACMGALTRYLQATRTVKTEQNLLCPDDAAIPSMRLSAELEDGYSLDGPARISITPDWAGKATGDLNVHQKDSRRFVEQQVSCSTASAGAKAKQTVTFFAFPHLFQRYPEAHGCDVPILCGEWQVRAARVSVSRLGQAALLLSLALGFLANGHSAELIADKQMVKLRSKVDTVVIIYLTGRSFDNLFGMFPGARGIGEVLGSDGLPTKSYLPQRDRDGHGTPGVTPDLGRPYSSGFIPIYHAA